MSIEITDFLAYFCNVDLPVKKACGKRKPDIQNTVGIGSSIHASLYESHSVNKVSYTQASSGLREG